MNENNWNPFTEAKLYLPEYKYFFERTDDVVIHPQVIEDWLEDHAPQEYCYTWVRYFSGLDRYGGKQKSTIKCMLFGLKDESVSAMYRLMFDHEMHDVSGYYLRQTNASEEWEFYAFGE